MNNDDKRHLLWQRNAVMAAAALVLLTLFFHTRMAWLYFQPDGAALAGLLPRLGPGFPGECLRHAGRILLAGLFFLSLPGLGKLCLPRREFPPFTATALGLFLWAMLGFCLAAAGASRPAVLKSLSLVLVGLGLWKAEPKAPRFAWNGETAALLAFGALYLLTTLVPETFYDALVYHLAAPQAWLRDGRMTDMPDVHLWRLPGLLQPLYLWALAWSDDRLCKLLTVGIGFLTAGLLGRWTADRWGRPAGLWAALLFLSAPMVGVNLWDCANDIPAGFFCFLALALWLKGTDRAADRSLIFLAGLFLGAGAAVKSTALFGAPFFLLDAGTRRLRRGPPVGPGLLLLFGAGALLPLLPWWARAAAWTGNPFFPHAAGWLGGDGAENLALLKVWHADAGGSEGRLFRLLSLARESLRGVEDGRFGFVGPALLMLLPLAFFLRPDPVHGLLAGYGLTAYLFFILASGRLRYFIPHLPPLFALAAAALTDTLSATAAFPGRIVPRLNRLLKGAAAAAVVLNGFWLLLAFQRFNQGFPVVWGRQSARDYLLEEHIGVYGHPSQGAFDWLADNGAQGRVFVVGEARTFRCPLPATAAGNFNVPAYASRTGEPPSAGKLLESLKAEGFTYLLVNVEEIKRITPEPYKTPPYLAALGGAFDRLSPPVYRDRWCILFKV